MRRNWVSIWSLKNIINSLANPAGRLKTFQFGKDDAADKQFVKNLRVQIPPKYLELLGINNISNSGLMKELTVVNEGVVSGSPRVEIVRPCPKKVCKKVYKKEEKHCPGPRIKKIVKEIYVDICEQNTIKCTQNVVFLPKNCGMEQCNQMTVEYCNSILTNLRSE